MVGVEDLQFRVCHASLLHGLPEIKTNLSCEMRFIAHISPNQATYWISITSQLYHFLKKRWVVKETSQLLSGKGKSLQELVESESQE